MTHFEYEGFQVLIVPCLHKGKKKHQVVINGRPLFFVTNPDTAKRLATRFIDVLEPHPCVTSSRLSKH